CSLDVSPLSLHVALPLLMARSHHVWEADWIVTSHLAKSLIETLFPQLVPISVKEFGVGWDNTAFLVNDSFVSRFPRRRIAVPLIDRNSTRMNSSHGSN